MKRAAAGAGVCGLAALVAALAAPAGADRPVFAAALAPVLFAFAAPFALPVPRDPRRDAAFAGAAGAAGGIALAPFVLAGAGWSGVLGLAVLLAAWTALLTGLFRAGSRRGAGTGHLVATGFGLVLCSTHLLFDPLVQALDRAPGPRQALIRFTLNANPSLLAPAAFWQRDLLKSSFGYARSEIGSFHGYVYGGWGWTAAAYAVCGVALWFLGRRATEEGDVSVGQEPARG